MTLGADFVEDVEHPSHPVLQQALTDACELTEERLREMGFRDAEDWLVRKLAYAYFHDWTVDSPRYAFVLPDPGNLGKEYIEEVQELRAAGPEITPDHLVALYREIAKEWLLDHDTDFPERFLRTVSSTGLVDYSSGWREYIRSNSFFDDFYMTDVLKYRVNGYESGSELESLAFRRHLKQELTAIEPRVIFVFGGAAWNTVRRFLNPEPVNPAVGDETSIMDSHGDLYCTDTPVRAFVLPLAHMSGQIWWRFPPEDYIKRLNDVLTELEEISTDSFRPPDSLCETEDSSEGREPTVLDEIAEDVGEVNEFEPDR